MEGQSVKAVQLKLGVSESTLKNWRDLFWVDYYLDNKTIGALLQTGVFHITSGSNLRGIISSEEIIHSGAALNPTWQFNTGHYAKTLGAVAVFDFNWAGPLNCCETSMKWGSIIRKQNPAFCLRLDPLKLPNPLTRFESGKNLCHNQIPWVESWHVGSVPWSAVSECWCLFMLDGQQALERLDIDPTVLIRQIKQAERALAKADKQFATR